MTKHYQVRRRWNNTWKRITMGLASVVVFCTVYALILPAITLESQYICGKEAHIHTDECFQYLATAEASDQSCSLDSLKIHDHTTECYNENSELICGIADFVLHTHSTICYDENGSLRCLLPEVEAHTHGESCWKQPHIHEAACYTVQPGELSCTLPEGSTHTHTDACMEQTQALICELTEATAHFHEDSCYAETMTQTCQLSETDGHTHDDTCYIDTEITVCPLSEADGHAHVETCFASIRTLNCETPEGDGHTHGEGCFESALQLICEIEETEGHTHSELCYQTVGVVSCGLEADIPHSHSNNCYAQIQQLTCEQLTVADGAQASLICEMEVLIPHIHIAACQNEQGAFICGNLALEQHSHNSDCFATTNTLQLVCDLAEHTHTDDCKAEEQVPAETLDYTCSLAEHTHDALCSDENGTLICTLTEHTHDTTCLSETVSDICILEEHLHDELCFDADDMLTCTLTEHLHDDICGVASSNMILMSARPNTVIDSGTVPNDEGVADAITWTLTEDSRGVRTLTFSGTGAMQSYEASYKDPTNNPPPPWMAYKNDNTHLVFEEGITRVGPYSFARDFNLLSIDFGPTVTSIGANAFIYTRNLTAVTIPGNIKTIEADAFLYSYSLYNVTLEEGVETVGGSAFHVQNSTSVIVHIPASLTSIGRKAFYSAKEYVVAEGNNNFCSVDGVLYSKDMTILVDYPRLKAAAEYRVPNTVTTIGNAALCNVASTDKLYIPGTVKTVTGRLADSSVFKEVHLENGFSPVENGKPTGMGLWFYLTQNNLKVLTLPEDTSYTLGQFFYNGGTFQLEGFTYPQGVTKINRVSHATAVPYFPYLREIRYDAQAATLTASGSFSDIWGENTTFPLVIGPNVDVLDNTFYLLSDFATEFTFEGNNYISAAAGSFVKAPSPLAGLSGELYVDSQGVVYRYDAIAKTAELVYVSPGTQTLSVPAAIPAADGTLCTVNAVKQDAFAAATVSALTIEAPQNITVVETNAFANCKVLASVNGETTEDGAIKLFANATLGYKPFYNTALEPTTADSGYTDGTPGVKELTVSSTSATDMTISLASQAKTIQWAPVNEEETMGTWKLLTGDNLIVNIAAGNDTATDQHTYRVYFRYEKGCEMNFEPGNTYTFEGQTVTCHSTADPDTVYLEFTPPVSNTAAFSVTALYPSPDSNGGHVTIWGEVVTGENTNIEPTPGATLEADWYTKPDSFLLAKKTVSEALMTVWADETGILRPSATLNWEITMTRAEDEVSAYGKDYVTSVDVVDTMALPTGVSWDPAVLEAVQSGGIRRSGTDLYLNEKKIVSAAGAVASSVALVWNESTQTVELHYRLNNLNAEAEITLPKVTVNFLPAAFVVDGSNLASDAKVENRVQATVHYNYSSDVLLESSDDRPIGLSEGSISLAKSSSAGNSSYFGEDVTYTITMKNNGATAWTTTAAPLYLLDKLPAQAYIQPGNMERMFLDDTDLMIVLQNAALKQSAAVTDAYGDANGALVTVGNSGSPDDGTGGNLVVLRYDDTKYTADIYYPNVTQPNTDQLAKGEVATPSETVSADSVSNLLRMIGYDLTAQDAYTCIWYPAEAITDEAGRNVVTVMPGAAITRQVYATFRDTFHQLKTDWPNSYDSTGTGQVTATNNAYLKTSTSEKEIKSAGVSNTIKREAYVYKTVYRDGLELHDGFTVGDRNVLDYQLHFERFGNSTTENLPMVDDLYGSQRLLVPVAGNDHLQGLQTYSDYGVNYYILTEGTYADVKVGVDETGTILTAASITVSPATGKTEVNLGGNTVAYTGLHTEIKWYLPEISGDWYTIVRYKALTDLSIQDNGTYNIGNAVWMNDREGSRIYDFIWGGGTLITFEKHIVTQQGTTPADDVLAEHSLVEQGQAVTYRLTLTNINNHPFTLTGEHLADALPDTHGKFSWQKGINITDFKAVVGDGSITYENLENWYIGESYGGLLGRDQFILWPEETIIYFEDKSTLYLYFTLTFPEDPATWGNYLDVVSGSLIDNTLYVYQFPSTVTHNLKESGQVLLQKGVSGSYYFWKDHNDKYTPIGSSRFYYSTETSRDRAVLYYVTLYNGANKRLYLDTLTDMLPKGFTFESLHADGNLSNMTGKNSYMSIQTVTGKIANGVTTHPLIEDSLGSISFRSATVSATVTQKYNSQNVPPNEVVEFQISSPSSSTAANPVKYDESLGLYYLDKGEAIVFGVIAQIGSRYATEEAPATNTVSMPYLDYLSTGVDLIPITQLPIRATSDQVFPDYNDGDRQLLPGDTGQILQSQVTMYAGEVIPGVTKITDSYTTKDGNTYPYVHSAYYDATIHWRVLLHNSGAKQLQTYSFIDVLPKPYVFTGDVSVSIHDADGNVMRVEEVILTFPDRTGSTGTETALDIELPSNSSGTPAATSPITVPYSTYFANTPLYNAPTIGMSLFRDESGNEGMMLHFVSYGLAIPEGGYVEVELSAVNPTSDYRAAVFTNQATLVPLNDTFSSVGHGSLTEYVIKTLGPELDANGKPVTDQNGDYVLKLYEMPYPAVTNTAPVAVNLGIATSSEKQVTEKSEPTNTATSKDPNNNSIVLKDRGSAFTYTLLVENVSETTMSKMVLIDNLPEEGDHSPFHDYIQRNSQFTVDLASDPNFAVSIINPDGVTVKELDSSQYTIQYATTTDFGGPQSNDWKGLNTGTTAKWTSDPTGARAFRLIIEDPTPTDDDDLMPANCTVRVTFDAELRDNDITAASGTARDALPGEIAWNSFGYHYKLKSSNTELEAMPLTVGVKIPTVPVLKKELVDANGQPFPVNEDTAFRFLVHKGTALAETYDTAEALKATLDAAGTPYREFTVTVPQNKSVSDALLLELNDWSWEEGQAYTLLELPVERPYTFLRFTGTNEAYQTFTYAPDQNQIFTCVNLLEQWSVELTKTGEASDILLPGAVFALYSPEPVDFIVPDEFASLNVQAQFQKGGNTWYLSGMAKTEVDGKLSFTGLTAEYYYLLEVKAPDGYNLLADGTVLQRAGASGGVYSYTVANYPGYELPETGGSGVTNYRIYGGLLMAAPLLWVLRRQRFRGRRAAGG